MADGVLTTGCTSPKRLEFSESLDGPWQVIGVLPAEEADKKWPELQRWIREEQIFGFFRLSEIPEAEMIAALREHGWTESCLHEGYWNPPPGEKANLKDVKLVGSGWNSAIASGFIHTTAEAYLIEWRRRS